MNETTIKMNLFSGLLMIEVGLWSIQENKFKNMYLTVDTGASVTTISKAIIYQLGYIKKDNQLQQIKITTASGIEYVDSFTIDKLKINQIELNNIEVYSHMFPEESFSLGVIGLNVLQNFDIKLLFSQELITLKKIN